MSEQEKPMIVPEFDIVPDKTALVVIDMNYADAHRDYGAGIPEEARESVEPWFDEIDNKVIPGIQKLLDAFRKNRMKVLYTTCGAEMPDLSDMHPRWAEIFRRVGIGRSVPGNREFEIRDEVKPIEGELVLVKKSSGAFNTTNIDQVLRNWGIDTVVFVGIATNVCVYLSAADAGDRGYKTIVVSDATAALPSEMHDVFLKIGSTFYFLVQTTDEVINGIERALMRG